MRYLVILGLSLLVCGCDEEPPRPDPKPRTKDLIGVGVVEAPSGEIWVLAQEVDRWKSADPVHLDESIPPNYPYRFYSRTLKLEAGGRHFSSIQHDPADYGLVYHYSKVNDGYLIAGLAITECVNRIHSAVPMIGVRDEIYQSIRWAQASCVHAYPYFNEPGYDPYVSPMQIVKLANGNLLYYSARGHLICMSEYGEVLWSQESTAISNAIASLMYGGFAISDQYNNEVSWYDDDGNFVRNITFGDSSDNTAFSITQMPDSDYVIAGVSREGNDPYVWTYSSDFSLQHEETVSYLNCLDSVAVQAIDNKILLICKAGDDCGRPGTQRLLLLNRDLSTIAQESFGGETNVVVKDVTVGTDGSIYLCGAYDRGNGSYSALISKYTAELDAVWSTTVHPTL